MNENQNPKPAPMGGSKLSTIFLVVLGLHIVLIVAFSAYHLLKGDSSNEKPSEEIAEVQEKTPAADETPLPGHEEQPTVETQQTDTAATPAGEPSTTAEPAPLPMPASNDPIWTRVPAPEQAATTAKSPASPAPAPAFLSDEKPNNQPMATPKTHTVAKGDSLARVSRTYGVTVAELRAANGMKDDLIRIGQVLRVPESRGAGMASTVAKPTQPMVNAPVVRRAEVVNSNYTVGKGDTLWKIARKFNVNPQQLAAANGIDDPSKLKVGTVLRLPSGVEKQDLAQPPTRPEPAPVNTDMAMVPKN